MRQLNIKIEPELYHLAASHAKAQSTTLSEMVRQLIKSECHEDKDGQNGKEANSHQLDKRLYDELFTKNTQIGQLHQQLQEKDTQISELHRLVAMAQSNADKWSGQLDRANLQLEDLQQKKPLFSRIFGKG